MKEVYPPNPSPNFSTIKINSTCDINFLFVNILSHINNLRSIFRNNYKIKFEIFHKNRFPHSFLNRHLSEYKNKFCYLINNNNIDVSYYLLSNRNTISNYI